MAERFECTGTSSDDMYCDDLPCKGHRVTKAIDQAARVLAWSDGWDVMEESDQSEAYWQAGAVALLQIGAHRG